MVLAQGGPGGPAGRGEPERGQGYRKLWQQVTKVGRGQKLGEGAEAVPFSDMTVEDLLRIVRSLPPEESAVAAVSRGLFYLDSRALAALLKELHKVGLSNRCALALFHHHLIQRQALTPEKPFSSLDPKHMC